MMLSKNNSVINYFVLYCGIKFCIVEFLPWVTLNDGRIYA